MVTTIRKGAFAAAVAAALAFGAAQAAASPAAARTCDDPSIGACGSRLQCLQMCSAVDPTVTEWNCSGGCCYCGLP